VADFLKGGTNSSSWQHIQALLIAAVDRLCRRHLYILVAGVYTASFLGIFASATAEDMLVAVCGKTLAPT
jgi:hypothetical protein